VPERCRLSRERGAMPKNKGNRGPQVTEADYVVVGAGSAG
jgi:hypothetical protein